MSAGEPNTSFEEAFQKLITCLSQALRNGNIVSLAPDVLEPFRHLTSPIKSKHLRSLAKLFDGKTKDDAVRLNPRTFYAVYTIVFQFPHSRIQERLLHNFLDVIALYKNEKAAAEKLSRVANKAIDDAAIRDGREYICQKLGHQAFVILQTPESTVRTKRTAAQTLIGLLAIDEDAVSKIINDKTIQCIYNTICNEANCVLRLLVADIARRLIKQKERDFEPIFRQGPSQLTKEKLYSIEANSAWLGSIVGTLSSVDAARATNDGVGRIFRLASLEFDDGLYSDHSGNILAVFSDCISFILPAVSGAKLSIIEVPYVKDMIIVNSDTSDTGDPETKRCTVKVGFPARDADRYFQGTRKAIDEFQIILSQESDLKGFTEFIRNCTTQVTPSDRNDTPKSDSPLLAPRKQSLMFTIMDWNSEDGAWDRRGQSNALGQASVNNAYRAIDDIATDSPAMITNNTEFEQVAGRESVLSNSMKGQSTDLYERMRSYQEGELMSEGLEKNTPQVYDVDEHSSALDEIDHVSPTLRLSQGPMRDLDGKPVRTTVAADGSKPPYVASIDQRQSILYEVSANELNAIRTKDGGSDATALMSKAESHKPAKSEQLDDTGHCNVNRISNGEAQDKTLDTGYQEPAPTTAKALNVQMMNSPGLENAEVIQSSSRKIQRDSRRKKAAADTTVDWNRDLRVDSEHGIDVQPIKRGRKSAATKRTHVSKDRKTTENLWQQIKQAVPESLSSQVVDGSKLQTGQQMAISAQIRRGTSTNPAEFAGDFDVGVPERDTEKIEKLTNTIKTVDNIGRRLTLSRSKEPFPEPTTPCAIEGAKGDQPILVSSASQMSSNISSPGIFSNNPSITTAKRVSKRTHSAVEQLASPPVQHTKRRRSARAEPNGSHDEDADSEVAAQDSYPLSNADKSIAVAADASFASKLDQMIAEGGDNKEAGMSTSTAQPATPFGNREKFIARVNAAKNSSLEKPAKKFYGKKPHASKAHIHDLRDNKLNAKQLEKNVKPSTDADNSKRKSEMARSKGQERSCEAPQAVMTAISDRPVLPCNNLRRSTRKTLDTQRADNSFPDGVMRVEHARSPVEENVLSPARNLALQQMSSKPSRDATEKRHSRDTKEMSSASNLAADMKTESNKTPKTTAYNDVVHNDQVAEAVQDMDVVQEPLRGQAVQFKHLDKRKDTNCLDRTPLPEANSPDDENHEARQLPIDLPSLRNGCKAKTSIGQKTTKPHVVHFGRHGPVNQGKSHEKLSKRQPLPANFENTTDDMTGLGHHYQPTIAPDKLKSQLNLNISGSASASALVDEEDGTGPPLEEEGVSGFITEKANMYDCIPMSHLPQEYNKSELFTTSHSTRHQQLGQDSNSNQDIAIGNHSDHPVSSRISGERRSEPEFVPQEGSESGKLSFDRKYPPHTCKMHSLPEAGQSQFEPQSELRKMFRIPVASSRRSSRKLLASACSAIETSNKALITSAYPSTNTHPETGVLALQDCQSGTDGSLPTTIPVADRLSTGSNQVQIQRALVDQNLAPSDSARSDVQMPIGERSLSSVKLDIQRMPPPPPPGLKTSGPCVTDSYSCASIENKSNYRESIGPVRVVLKQVDGNVTELRHSPKRRKSNCQTTIENNTLLPVGTPVSLSTILCNDLKEIERQVEDQKKGSRAIETSNVDDKQLAKEQSFLRLNKANTPEFTEDTASLGPDLAGTPAPESQDRSLEGSHKQLSPQSGLRESLSNLTRAVLFRLNNEEVAIQSRVSLYNLHAEAVLHRIQASWTEKIKYEKDMLLRNLRKDKQDLDGHAASLETMENAVGRRELDEKAVALVDEREKILLQRLKAFIV